MLTLPRISRHQMKDSKEERGPWKLAITCRKRRDVASLGNLLTPKEAPFPSLSVPGRSATLVIGQAVGSVAKKDRREAAQRDCLTVVL